MSCLGRVMNCREVIPLLLEAGIDCLQPLEVAAGMDVTELGEEYGDGRVGSGVWGKDGKEADRG